MAKKLLEEDFWKIHAGNWTVESGVWKIKPEVAVYDFAQKDIYRSSQMPSHVQWAGIRTEKNGALKISFIETIGDRVYPPTYGFFAGQDCGATLFDKTIISRDSGQTWSEWGQKEKDIAYYRRPPVTLNDGSLLQLVTLRDSRSKEMHSVPVFKESLIGSIPPYVSENVPGDKLIGQFRVSHNGGKTWKYYPALNHPFFLFVTVKQISDGSLIAVGGMPRHRRDNPLTPIKPDVWDVYLSESYDQGRTWTAPKVIQRSPGKISILNFTEEIDFVELENDRFLFLARVHPLAPNLVMMGGTNVVQFYGEKKGPGKWSFRKPEITLMPHSGFPQMIPAKDGAVIYHNTAGIFFTLDEGTTWLRRLNVDTYYPSLLQLPDGEILATCHTLGGDTPYPPEQDMAIKLLRFRYKRIGWLEQTDNQAIAALNRLDCVSMDNFHLSVDFRHDGCEGVAFHLNEKESFLAYLHAPRSSGRVVGNSPEHKEQTSLVIARLSGDELKILTMRDIGKQELCSWYQMQISVKGRTITAAIHHPKKTGEYPFFLSAEIEKPCSGGFGLFTDLSTAAFTNLKIWPKPGDMRLYWERKDFSSGGAWKTLP